MAEVDREGVRIAAAAKSAYDLILSRSLRHARLGRTDGIDASYETFVRDGLAGLAALGVVPRGWPAGRDGPFAERAAVGPDGSPSIDTGLRWNADEECNHRHGAPSCSKQGE